jgi:thiaminase/transcriptional activator TenA
VTFTDDIWEETTPIREAIDDHPFQRALEDGSLSQHRFAYYLEQDALYLGKYARVLAAAAAQASRTEEVVFWSERATSAITVERTLHESLVGDPAELRLSPTCTAYTSFLLSLAGGGCYPELAAGILPCFWIYEDVGRRLHARLDTLDAHPYARWIATYDDPAFATATTTAKGIIDTVAAESSRDVQRRMAEAFVTAARYEWMFWDAAWRTETWPV